MRNYFCMFRVDSMETIFRVLVYGPGGYHSNKLAAKDVERFLTHLAPEGKVAASTATGPERPGLSLSGSS